MESGRRYHLIMVRTGGRDPRRRFTSKERVALYLAADGHCEHCGIELQPGFHGDHVIAHTHGGTTNVLNGAALCPPCNLTKGASVQLREWQRNALARFDATGQENFLVTATPGAGKTTFALELARRLKPTVKRVIIVVPTSHLRTQWARAATRFGIHLDNTFTNHVAALARDYDGTVVTYQSVAASPLLYAKLSENALVVLDEVHHAGESKSWGDSIRTAFDPAHTRLLLSGTPFRSDSNPIPYVNYQPDENGVLRSRADYTYGYGDGVKDAVVRPIAFPAFDGEATWREAGTVVQGPLHNDDEKSAKRALKAALKPDGDWIKSVLRAADAELTNFRQHTPDAGGLVIADDQSLARAYSTVLERYSGEKPAVAISDDPDASDTIRRFAEGRSKWLIAVQMVSEGVDIPRLVIGVYASRTTTPLFFQQVVGRFVRTRDGEDDTCATLYVPSIRPLLQHAAELEEARDHALTAMADRDPREGNFEGGDGTALFTVIEPISSSEATHHRTILSGQEYTEDEITEASRMIELVGGGAKKMAPAEMAQLIRNLSPAVTRPDPATPSTPQQVTQTLSEQKTALRKIIQRKVGQLQRYTGREYSHIHMELNQGCGESSIKEGTIESLNKRITMLDQWIMQAHAR